MVTGVVDSIRLMRMLHSQRVPARCLSHAGVAARAEPGREELMSLPTFIVWLLIVIIGDVGLFLEIADWVQTGAPINFNYLFFEGESTAMRIFGIIALIVGNGVVLYYLYLMLREKQKKKAMERQREESRKKQLLRIRNMKRR